MLLCVYVTLCNMLLYVTVCYGNMCYKPTDLAQLCIYQLSMVGGHAVRSVFMSSALYAANPTVQTPEHQARSGPKAKK